MLCNDPSISYLKSFGYNVVRLPKADIAPLQILTKNGNSFENLGDLLTVLVAGTNITPPAVKKDEITASISGQRTSDLSAGIGLDILGNIIGAMGGSKVGLQAQYSNARTLSFEFQNVLTDSISVVALDMYLSDADVNPFSKHVKELLEADDIYIITSVIKSNTVSVSASAKNKTEVAVDIPVVQEIVGGNIKVGANTDKSSATSFSGTVPLIFGFKAVKLSYEDGKYTAFEPVTAGVNAMSASSDGGDGTKLLIADSALVSIGNI